jgi:hypothetical protein
MDIELRFARAVGIPTSKNQKYNMITITAFTTNDLRGQNVPDPKAVNKFFNNPKKAKMPDSK